jgi:hypothetical protein
MVVPLAVRGIVAAIGVLLIWTAARSMIGTVIVPRPVGSWLTRWVDKIVSFGYGVAASKIKDHKRRDRLMAGQAAVILLMQLLAWLLIFFVGYSLLLWPFITPITSAFTTAGPALFEIGSERASGATERVILDIAALTGIITVTLQIAYLPTLYSAYNRRETEVALLNARAGIPSWGPELLARTHYALGSGMSTINTLPDLYAAWERWAADVAESHTTYLPLVRFRSPKSMSSWVTALLSVLDSAALFLVLSPKQAPEVAARLCLRSGFICFGDVARAMGFDIPLEPDPSAGISVTYEQFADAVARMEKVNFPIDRTPEEAWPDFVGWRVNYEQAAYAIAYALDVVPALWSGPRRHPRPEIAPIRPPEGKPPDGKETDHKPAEGTLAKGSSAEGKPADGKVTHHKPAGDGPAGGRPAHHRPADGKTPQ